MLLFNDSDTSFRFQVREDGHVVWIDREQLFYHLQHLFSKFHAFYITFLNNIFDCFN